MNIRTFKDIDPKKDNKNKDNKKTTDAYTGGHSSGLNVENPEDDVDGFNSQETKIKITLWRNGFQINDGEFRDAKLPENQKFLDDIEKRQLPKEFANQGLKNVGIQLLDNRKEDFKAPVEEKKFKAFEGKGNSLANAPVSQGLEINKDVKFEVDHSKPTTKINFRLHNGQTITQVFNTTHTLQDVRVFVGSVAPVNGTYDLIEGFPPKPLSGDNKTIKELKIENSTVTQKLT